MSHYFRDYAQELQQKGYDVVPIKPYEKKITLSEWQSHPSERWLSNPRQGWKGVSHRTKTAPAIDVDVTDEGIANQLAIWLNDRGFQSFRYGDRPKFACIGRWADAPQKKCTSKAYDINGTPCRIEILGDGQQIVLLNQHPKGFEYTWTEDIPAVEDCPVLTDALVNELFDYYEELCGDRFLVVGGRERILSVAPASSQPLSDEAVIEILQGIDPDCGYDEWFRIGAAIYHQNGNVDLWDDWSGSGSKYPGRDEIEKKWQTFATAGHKASLNQYAEQQAFDIFTSPAVQETLYRLEMKRAKDQYEDAKKRANAMFRCAVLMVKNRIDPNWLIKGILEKDTVSLLFGDFTTFKSFIALDLGLHVAAGMDWRNCKTHSGPVFFLAGEGHGGLDRRVQAWHQYHDELPDRFYASTMAANLMVHEQMSEMMAAMEQLESAPALVIIDTLASSSGGGDENSATDISKMLAEVNILRRRWKCAVLIVHHTGQKEKDRARGSYALPAGVDCMYRADRAGEGMNVTLKNTKMKDGRPPEPMLFEAVEVELGRDSEGDPVTSLIIAHDMLTPAQASAMALKLKGATATAFEVLFEVGGEMLVDEWSEATQKRLTNSKPKGAFFKAKNTLLERGVIELKSGHPKVFSAVLKKGLVTPRSPLPCRGDRNPESQ